MTAVSPVKRAEAIGANAFLRGAEMVPELDEAFHRLAWAWPGEVVSTHTLYAAWMAGWCRANSCFTFVGRVA